MHSSPTLQRFAHPRSQRGIAAVEFALVLPLLLLLLMGVIDISFALYNKSVITNASREGARAGIVARNPPLPANEMNLYVKAVVDRYVHGSLVSFHGGDPSSVVSTKMGIFEGDPTLEVTVAYNFQGVLISGLFDTLGKELRLVSSTVMLME